MKYVVWLFMISISVYGGIFLMPYKVTTAFSTLFLGQIVGALIFGLLAGWWISKSKPRVGIEPLQLVAASFLISGTLGLVFNLLGSIEGFPDFSVLVLIVGLGMFIYWLAFNKRQAS